MDENARSEVLGQKLQYRMDENTREALREKKLHYVIDYLQCHSSKVCYAVLEDPEFRKTVKAKCTQAGLERFYMRVKTICEVLEEREKDGKKPPLFQTRNGEVVVNGQTRTEALREVRKGLGEPKKLDVTIMRSDRVLVKEFDGDMFPDGIEGLVDTIQIPRDSYSPIEYEVDIPIYDKDGYLLTEEYTCCDEENLTLLERWDNEKECYHTSNLDKPVYTCYVGYRAWNEFEEHSYAEDLDNEGSDKPEGPDKPGGSADKPEGPADKPEPKGTFLKQLKKLKDLMKTRVWSDNRPSSSTDKSDDVWQES